MHNVTQLLQTARSSSFEFPSWSYRQEESVFEVVPDGILLLRP